VPTRHRWTTAPIHRSGRDGALCGIPRNGPTPARCALFLAAILIATCGGGSTSHQPTSPSPAPPVPVPSSACNAITGNLGLSLGIVNGALCSSADSSVVRIHWKDETGAFISWCSGTVIAPRAVLTAAHCVLSAAGVDVDPGSGPWVGGASFVVYPPVREFRATSNDVAVVFTVDDLPRSPIPILTSRKAEVGEPAVVAGWGRNENDLSGVLRAGMTTVTRVGVGELQTQYDATTGSGICAGDSGGPLLLSEGGTWAVAGVTTAGSEAPCSAPATSYYVMLGKPDTLAFVLSVVPDALRR